VQTVKGIRTAMLTAAMAILIPLGNVANAADLYQTTIVEDPALNATDFHLMKPGNKLKVTPAKPKKNPMDPMGPMLHPGMTIQLILKNVDCFSAGNDGVTAGTGKCGVAVHGMTPASPVPAVLGLSVHTLGLDIFGAIGLPIQFVKGTATFVATGKNKFDGTDPSMALLIGMILSNKIGFHVPTIQNQGTVPADCASIPLGSASLATVSPTLAILAPGGVAGCLDGNVIAFGGITVGD
jgi:hypothetical protein